MKYRQAKKFLKQEMATAWDLLEENPLNGSARAMYRYAESKLAKLKRDKKK